MKFTLMVTTLACAASISEVTFCQSLDSAVSLSIDASPIAIHMETETNNAVAESVGKVRSMLNNARGNRLSLRIESSAAQVGIESSPLSLDRLSVYQMALLGEIMAYNGVISSISVSGVEGIDDHWIKGVVLRNGLVHLNLMDLDSVTAEAFHSIASQESTMRVIVCRCPLVNETELRRIIPQNRLVFYPAINKDGQMGQASLTSPSEPGDER